MWLKDAKRRLEQANNEELQLKVKLIFIHVIVILCHSQHTYKIWRFHNGEDSSCGFLDHDSVL